MIDVNAPSHAVVAAVAVGGVRASFLPIPRKFRFFRSDQLPSEALY